MTQTETRAVVPYSAMAVSDDAAAREAGKLMKHAADAGGLFPSNMTQAQAVQLARLSLGYGLDPFAEELILYQGKPYLTIKGALRIANSHPRFEGIECVPATDDERKAFRCRDDEHLWKATVWKRGYRVPVVNYGRASAGDGNPVSSKWAQEMAQKRARHRALRDAFSLPVPGQEEREEVAVYEPGPIIEGEVVEAPKPIRRDQITAIHAIVGTLGWEDDDYRLVLRDTYQVNSSTDLTEGQASSVIDMLRVLEQEQSARRFLATIRAKYGTTLDTLSLDDSYVDGTPRKDPTDAVVAPEPAPAAEPFFDRPMTEGDIVVDPDDLDEAATSAPLDPPELHTTEQREKLERRASPAQLKKVNWDTLTYVDAETWIESLEQR